MNNPEEDKKGAAVKFPPPLMFVFFIAVASALDYVYPLLIIELADDSNNLRVIAIALFSLAMIIVVISFFTFRFAKTTIEPWKPTSNIISTGIFSYSRNPIYLAFFIITLAIGLYFNSWWIIASSLPGVLCVYNFAIKNEEAYLEAKFGDEYRQYKNKVRRWV